MIIIDGHQSDLRINNFANLEEILNNAVQDSYLENRIVTEVRLNERHFSELYEHQAADIEVSAIKQLEITSMASHEVAFAISEELFTVLKIMHAGSENVARLFQQADDKNAIDLLIDLLSVTRDFLGMVSVLRADFLDKNKEQMDISQHIEAIANLLGEMTEVMEAKDWILLADLIEYEFMPQCDSWKDIITQLQASIPKE